LPADPGFPYKCKKWSYRLSPTGVIEFFAKKNHHQRGEASMLQGVLGFKYEEEKHATGMTGLAGLPVCLDLPHMMALPEQIGRHLQVKQRGWRDAQMALALKSWKPFSVTRYSGCS